MSQSDIFWSSSLEDLKKGYREELNHYQCLLCGEQVEKGVIYPHDGILYEAKRYIRLHIEKEHGSVFDYLLWSG